MVSVTVSVPTTVKKKMADFPEINWSGFIRKSIEKKVEELNKRDALLKQLEKEKELMEWSVIMGRKMKKGRFKELQKQGLV
jgi:hypothetical protein